MELDLQQGLTTITGETGAGKSILLGALGLIQGKRADLSVIRDSSSKCVVETEFEIDQLAIQDFFVDHDLDYEPLSILRREISPFGKSRAFVNDTPVNLRIMKALGDLLIDIHSQHQTLELAQEAFQLDVLQSFVDRQTKKNKQASKEIRVQYSSLFKNYQDLQSKYKDLKSREAELTKELDYNSYLFNELKDANLDQLDEDELQSEYEQLNNVEAITDALNQAQNLISQDDLGILDSLRTANSNMDGISSFKKEYQSILERLESARLELEDITSEIELESNKLESDPERLNNIESNLTLLNNLYKKHQADTVAELIIIRDELERKVNQSLNFESDLKKLSSQIDKSSTELLAVGEDLRIVYAAYAKELSEEIIGTVRKLGMPQAEFEVKLIPFDQPKESGLDRVVFLFTANKGSQKLPLDKAASGGELSRLMLAIKSVTAQSKVLPTIIFDEIDTGVSGAIAEQMAGIMNQMSEVMQVITITHLPQIAAAGSDHLKVFKVEGANSTASNLKRLDSTERIEEIAQMLSGNQISEAARENARILLN
jgi:DNA repair protein RecN (Recombination protein N)